MDKKELYKRVLAELRDLGSGESLSVVGLAEEMGEPDSVIADVLEILHRHNYAWCSGRGCYSPSPKCRKAAIDEIMSELGGCTTEKPRPEPEPVKEDHATQEPRPSADRVCRFCGKVMEPNKVRRHENLCGKNPDSVANSRMRKATKEESIVTNATANIEPEPVPDPAEYAEESNVAYVLDFEVPLEDHITQAGGTDFPAMPDDDLDNGDLLATIEQIAAGCPDLPDEVPPAEVPPLEEVARIAKCDMLVLKGSPGMDAALRLIAYCQQMVNDGADMSLESSVKIADGFYISVSLDIPKRESDE